ncbi:hypothetical protein DFH28DRAFT_984209 [Melampsora americana]|nr:hypothetical protein DFH28DRAFT_984209 [Melampsora americana]
MPSSLFLCLSIPVDVVLTQDLSRVATLISFTVYGASRKNSAVSQSPKAYVLSDSGVSRKLFFDCAHSPCLYASLFKVKQ